MSAVWYTGRANSRTISVAEWASVGVTVAQPTVWDKSNGYSLPQAGFSPTQLTILDNNENFQINAADGPRTGAVPQAIPRSQALAKLSDLDDLQAVVNNTYALLGYPAKPGAFTSLMGTLAEGKASCALNVLGDSTGVTTGKTRWPQIVGAWLVQKFPAYGLQTVTWDDGVGQAMGAPVVNVAPPLGASSVTFSAASVQHPGHGVPTTGDLDVRVKVSSPDWTVNTVKTLVAYFGGLANTRAFKFSAKPGALVLAWSEDGITQNYSRQISGVTFPADGSPIWLRATLGVNVAGQWQTKFYTSTDGTTWTQVGGAGGTWTNNTGPTSVYQATGWMYEAGANQGSVEPHNGTIYAVEVRNGIDGPSMVPSALDGWAANGTVTRNGSPMLTIVNGSAPGRDVVYLSDSTRLPKMTPYNYGTRAVVLNCSHNDGTRAGSGYLASWDAWLTQVRNRFPYAGVAVTTQNPRTAPAANVEAHAMRRRDLLLWAAKNGLSLVDAYRAFAESATPLSSLVDSDGIHPSDATGSPLWADTVERALLGRA